MFAVTRPRFKRVPLQSILKRLQAGVRDFLSRKDLTCCGADRVDIRFRVSKGDQMGEREWLSPAHAWGLPRAFAPGTVPSIS